MILRTVFFCDGVIDLKNADDGHVVKAAVNPSYDYFLKYVPTLLTINALAMLDFEFEKDETGYLSAVLKHVETGAIANQIEMLIDIEEVKRNKWHSLNAILTLSNSDIKSTGRYELELEFGGVSLGTELLQLESQPQPE